MRCGDLMRMSVFVCHATDTVARCAEVMRDQNIGFLPVVDDGGRPIGIATDRDLVLRILAADRPAHSPVLEAMTCPVLSCHPDDTLRTAEARMVASGCSRIVVVDEVGRCVGVITLDDIAQAETLVEAGRVLQQVTLPRVTHKR
jgi:CBS domain-containing protein